MKEHAEHANTITCPFFSFTRIWKKRATSRVRVFAVFRDYCDCTPLHHRALKRWRRRDRPARCSAADVTTCSDMWSCEVVGAVAFTRVTRACACKSSLIVVACARQQRSSARPRPSARPSVRLQAVCAASQSRITSAIASGLRIGDQTRTARIGRSTTAGARFLSRCAPQRVGEIAGQGRASDRRRPPPGDSDFAARRRGGPPPLRRQFSGSKEALTRRYV